MIFKKGNNFEIDLMYNKHSIAWTTRARIQLTC